MLTKIRVSLHVQTCRLLLFVVALTMTTHITIADDKVEDQLAEFLYQGRLAQGETELEAKLKQDPNNSTVRASLGIVQFVKALEGLTQDYYRYGMEPQRRIAIGGVLLQANTSNPTPEPISYSDARGVFERLEQRLIQAEKTLSEFRFSGIKITLDVSRLMLDMNGDGKLAGNIPLASIIAVGATGNPNNATLSGNPLIFAFDDADVLWLRGYIHVLLGTVNVALAHDWRDAFERTAHLVFEKPVTPYSFLLEEGETANWSINQIVDTIAMIHVINFEVIEPKRMMAALEHYEQVVALSRTTWKWIREEQDNDREWLPGPTQNALLLGGRVGGRLGEDWEKVLDRTELVLQGKELIPYWRGYEGANWMIFNTRTDIKFHPEIGINLRKIFTQPKRFDMVLWLQGTGVAPFLEKGKTIDLKAWQDLSESFGGRLPFFSIWIN